MPLRHNANGELDAMSTIAEILSRFSDAPDEREALSTWLHGIVALAEEASDDGGYDSDTESPAGADEPDDSGDAFLYMDERLLVASITAAEAALEESGEKLQPERKARLILEFYWLLDQPVFPGPDVLSNEEETKPEGGAAGDAHSEGSAKRSGAIRHHRKVCT